MPAPASDHLRNAIVLSVDGLGTFCLGPYGNTWVDTPTLNRLACDAMLAEQTLVTSARPHQVFQSWWYGAPAIGPVSVPGSAPDSAEAIPGRLRTPGRAVHSVLLTDDAELERSDLANQFSDTILVPAPAMAPAGDLHQTQTARLLATAIDWLEQNGTEPFLLWIHASGMSGPWDAPADFRNQFAEEGDPLPGSFVRPPQRQLDADTDPDELLGLTHAYAGQVVVWDQCLAGLLGYVQDQPWWDRTLLLLTSPRGYPLGEHGRVGWGDAPPLYSELLQVPLLIRLPDRRWAGVRTQRLQDPLDIHATLERWFGIADVERGLPAENSSAEARCICIVESGERVLRSDVWLFREHQQRCELFAKPDDRWEINEVADRCPDVVAAAREYLDQFEEVTRQQLPPPVPSERLTERHD